ncbi:30S ribosomal protein S19 [Candidatus Parcubacteria bacterium]|nr:MAG: 30S ribosomal protein S19 [Candidatus Parcubacteria bacterium]
MSRSLKKGPYINPKILKKVSNLRAGDKTVIKVWDRACVISPEMVGFTFGVYNGKVHIPVKVIENMVGHRLGEFSPTRKFTGHGGRMAKELAIEAAQKEAETVKKAKEQASSEKK